MANCSYLYCPLLKEANTLKTNAPAHINLVVKDVSRNCVRLRRSWSKTDNSISPAMLSVNDPTGLRVLLDCILLQLDGTEQRAAT